MHIRHAQTGDEAGLAFLLEDHHRHYGTPAPPGSGLQGAQFLIQPPEGGALCLVAEREGELVGFAILNPYFPGPRLSHGLYLNELYVTAPARSLGVGERLIEAVRALAIKRGNARVIWTTGENNGGAQRFYERLGLRGEPKIHYIMDI